MSQEMSEETFFRESNLRNLIFNRFVDSSNDVVVERWKGWWTKPGEKKEQHAFLREFDIARFSQDEYGSLTLTGYEIKGMRQKDDLWEYPPFGSGLEQALSLLVEGADYSNLVTPKPQDSEAQSALKQLCESHCSVGLFFPEKYEYTIAGKKVQQIGLTEAVKAKRNTQVEDKGKRHMLTNLIASGQRGKIRVPDWAKK